MGGSRGWSGQKARDGTPKTRTPRPGRIRRRGVYLTSRPIRACLLLVVLDFGELGIDHVVVRRGVTGARVLRAARATLCRRGQRLRRGLELGGLGLDLALVVALHGRLQVRQRGLDVAD